MASKYIQELKHVASVLKEMGLIVSSEVCLNAATRMESLENYIVLMHEDDDNGN